MENVNNPLIDNAGDGIELNELEVVTAPLVTKGFEETIFATEIVKGDPDDSDDEDHNAQLNCVATSPDGLVIAAAGEDGTIHITDKNTGL